LFDSCDLLLSAFEFTSVFYLLFVSSRLHSAANRVTNCRHVTIQNKWREWKVCLLFNYFNFKVFIETTSFDVVTCKYVIWLLADS